MAVPPYVTAGTVIQETWGDQIANAVVNPFASSAARSAAITAPTNGMTSTITAASALNGFEVYNGVNWAKPWSMPWGFIQYTQTTTTVTSGNNVTILTGSTISVVNRRRYRITGFTPYYFSTAAANTAEVQIFVGGTCVGGQRVFTSQISSGENGATVVAYYTATATNTTLSCNLYSMAVVGTNHQYGASATIPIFIGVEDIGPSGAPA